MLTTAAAALADRTGLTGPAAVRAVVDAARCRPDDPRGAAILAEWAAAREVVLSSLGGDADRILELARYVRTPAGAARFKKPIAPPGTSPEASLITRSVAKRLTSGEIVKRATERGHKRREVAGHAAGKLDSLTAKTHKAKALGKVSHRQLQDLEQHYRELQKRPDYWREHDHRQTSGHKASHDAIRAEIGRRRDEKLRGLPDDQLDERMTAALGRNRLTEFDRYAREADRRDQEAQKATAKREGDRARRAARTAAQEEAKAAEYERLLASGLDAEHAYDDVYKLTEKQFARMQKVDALSRLRQSGYIVDGKHISDARGLDEAMRMAFKHHVWEQMRKVETTNRDTGEGPIPMLSREGQAKNINAMLLWTGNEEFARRWASEELKAWWDRHERPNFAAFSDAMITGVGSFGDSRGGDFHQ